MTNPESIRPREPTSPTGEGSPRTQFTLSPQQLAKARSRLSFLTLLFASMCLFGIGIDRFLSSFYAHGIYPVYLFNGITSIVLFVLTRMKRIGDRIVLNLGLLYEDRFALSSGTHFYGWATGSTIGLWAYARWKGLGLRRILDLGFPGVVLASSIGRIGCLMRVIV